ncbi:MAG: RHS repeat-associated core domain-containing protein [Paludibacteraceae bacterium]|nr:RHS repeat-associated core domain-containing protein [Paludibacteraceae bacterium]
MTDTAGNVSQFVCYTPYGESIVDEHLTTYENPFKFSGKELDDITGLYDHGARSRNPISTLWYGVDKLYEDYADLSPYSYCAGNPVKLVDPDGNAFWVAGAVIGDAIVGAVINGVATAMDPNTNKSQVFAATVGGAVSGGIAALGASVGQGLASGAAGSMAGNLVEQGINKLMGNQKEIDGTQVFIATGTGAVCNAGGKYVGKFIEKNAANKANNIKEAFTKSNQKVRPNTNYKEAQRTAQRNNCKTQQIRVESVKQKKQNLSYQKRNALSNNNTSKYLNDRKSDVVFSTLQNGSQKIVDRKINK